MSELKSRVMIAMLNVSVWSARAFDSNATEEVRTNHNKQDDIGRFNKRLLPAKAESYDAICKLAQSARAEYYRRTLRYGQDGVRLLPTSAYMDLAAKVREYKSLFPVLVDNFLEDLPNLKERQRVVLNGLFRNDDYPATGTLRERFGFRFKVLPFPDAEQFGVDLPDEELVQIRTDVREHAAEVANTAMRDLWERLYEVVARMATRLSQAKPIIRDTLVGNIHELVEILPSLNFTGDAKLTEVCTEVCNKLSSQSAKELRDNDSARKEVAKQAAAIQAQMAEYMGLPAPDLEPEEPSDDDGAIPAVALRASSQPTTALLL